MIGEREKDARRVKIGMFAQKKMSGRVLRWVRRM